VQQRFGVLTEFDLISIDDIELRLAIETRAGVYAIDPSSNVCSEFCQFRCWYKRLTKKKQQRSVNRYFSTHLQIAAHSWSFNRVSQYSSVCSEERSFLQLTRTKAVMQSTIIQQCLGVSAILSIERDLLHETDFFY